MRSGVLRLVVILRMPPGVRTPHPPCQNNRSNSFVNNSILSIQPTLLADSIGDANVRNGYTMGTLSRVLDPLCARLPAGRFTASCVCVHVVLCVADLWGGDPSNLCTR